MVNMQKGFTYILTLLAIVIIGISLSAAGRSWKTIVQRDREKELLFRGNQYKKAIESYYKFNNKRPALPEKLKDLLKDPRSSATVRHIRKLYPDPMTGDGAWVLIYDKINKIKGVKSSSTEEPFKKGNFPTEYRKFANKKRYCDWEFSFEPKTKGTKKKRVIGKGNKSTH
ncbi:MAG: type II secretion system protein [Thermodesulfobacteriota bacterium]|nr:type II secretion system protein [Thermodesulfobacteriota bacterium]